LNFINKPVLYVVVENELILKNLQKKRWRHFCAFWTIGAIGIQKFKRL